MQFVGTIHDCYVTVQHYDVKKEKCDGTKLCCDGMIGHWHSTALLYDGIIEHYSSTLGHFVDMLQHCDIPVESCDGKQCTLMKQ